MKTAKAHRKFAIYSMFLDTILEGEEDVRDGETRQDTLDRILNELEETAEKKRKEWAIKQGGVERPNAKTSIPVITKDKDRLEISIDNALSLDELGLIKAECWKNGLSEHFINKFNELNNGRQGDFTDGLD